MEPDLIANCPYKPGTLEHRAWIKEHVILKQLDQSTISWDKAKTIADARLSKLAAQYNTNAVVKATALENLIASLPVPGGIINLAIHAMIKEVNAVWQRTQLGIDDERFYLIRLPQIKHCPDWATEQQLFQVLRQASNEKLPCHRWMTYAIRKEGVYGLRFLMDTSPTVVDKLFGRVEVEYLLWQR